MSDTVIQRKIRQALTNKRTVWDHYRVELDSSIDLKVRLKILRELDNEVQQLIETVRNPALKATPDSLDKSRNGFCYPRRKVAQNPKYHQQDSSQQSKQQIQQTPNNSSTDAKQ